MVMSSQSSTMLTSNATRNMRSSKGLGNKISLGTKNSPTLNTNNGSLPNNNSGLVVVPDFTTRLTDDLLLRIFALLPPLPLPLALSPSLVSKRWLRLHSLLRESIRVCNWSFLETRRLTDRFPNLIEVDLTPAFVNGDLTSNVLFSHNFLSVPLSLDATDPSSIESFIQEHQISRPSFDAGLKILAEGCPGLQKLSIADICPSKIPPTHSKDSLGVTQIDGGELDSAVAPLEPGLAHVATNCSTLQSLELYHCTDESILNISSCKNLQVLKLVGSLSNGFFDCLLTDIGLTILARKFQRLVKLELGGCEASYVGIAAIGRCCIMLEELILSNQGFSDGWIAGLSFCSCLKTLRLERCKHNIDPDPGPLEHLGHCTSLEHLHLVRCNLTDREGFNALILLSMTIKELEFQDCWGLHDETFSLVSKCRRVRLLSIEGCSLLTAAGLEVVVMSWKDFQVLHVVHCNGIKDEEVSPILALQFDFLKELKWRPNTRSLLASDLAGTGIGQRGGKFFKKGGPS